MLAPGATYAVAVSVNPAAPYWETCSVANGSGTMGSGPVTNVAVTCAVGGNGSTGAPPTHGTIDTAVSTASAGAGSTTVTLSALANGLGFSAGQLVLLHQTQGNNAGQWEVATVVSTSGSSLTTLSPLENSYVSDNGSNHAQVLVIPQYSGVMTVSGTLTAPAWNGATGGILVFMDNNAVTVTGQITMTGQGYRGGGFAATAATCNLHCAFGVQGESSNGVGTNGAMTMTGSQSALSSNGAGGGGGAAGQDCGNGGGGAYGTAGTAGVNNTNGACSSAGDGNSQAGVTVGMSSLGSNILFGGAGGQGGFDEDGTLPGPGGNGGGIVLIFANTINISGGAVTANGTVGGNGTSGACPFTGGAAGGGCGMGGGGGGAGGGIRLAATSVTLGTAFVTSNGATGGDCSCTGAAETTNSGAGGSGRISVSAPTGAVMGSTSPVYDLE